VEVSERESVLSLELREGGNLVEEVIEEGGVEVEVDAGRGWLQLEHS